VQKCLTQKPAARAGFENRVLKGDPGGTNFKPNFGRFKAIVLCLRLTISILTQNRIISAIFAMQIHRQQSHHIVKIRNDILLPEVRTAQPQSFPCRVLTWAMNFPVVCQGFKKREGIVDKPFCSYRESASLYIQGNPSNFLNSGFENCYFSFAHLSISL